jgi:NAD(P)-dependent dehydrogenase (short-subunit alcohol dehydrogenase family)
LLSYQKLIGENEMRLKNKSIIIAGASSGIGMAAAQLFVDEGANVVLGARREQQLNEVADKLRQRGGRAVAVAGDVLDEAFAASLVERAKAEFGGLDAAFNNAGTIGEFSAIPEMSTANWNDVIATNLTSAFFAAKHQIPAMIERGGGSILFTSSFVGHTNAGMHGMGAYAASKAGLIGLAQSLASQHGTDRIRANTLLPGGTKTAMSGDDPEVHNYISGLHALGRMAEPEEIAKAALFVLSEEASFVTGTTLIADGGVSIKLG